MAELSDAGSAPPEGKRILGEPEVARSLLRIAHEVIERNRGVSDLVIMGIPSGGVPLAQRLARALATASQAAASGATAAPAAPAAAEKPAAEGRKGNKAEKAAKTEKAAKAEKPAESAKP